MDQRPPPAWDDSPEPDGEWVVAPGRPYPERLERGFKIAAAVAGLIAGAAILAAILFRGSPTLSAAPQIAEMAAVTLAFAGVAYAIVRAAGLLTVAAWGSRPGRRHYSLEWRGSPTAKGRNWEQIGGFIWAGLLIVAMAVLSHQ